MKLLNQFRRDESPLLLPSLIGDGVTVNDAGEVTGWAELPSRSTDHAGTNALFAMTSRGASELHHLIPQGAEGHFKIQWRTWTGADYLAAELKAGMTEGQEAYIRAGAARIDQIRYPRRQVLLGVRFDRGAPGRADGIMAKANKVTGLSDRHADARESLAETVELVRAWIDRMAGSSFKARPATVQQLAWALRRDVRRTCDWLPAGSVAGPGEVARLAASSVTPHVGHIEIMTDDGVRYLRLLTSTADGFPAEELSLPGGEWLKHLNITGLPGDEDAVTDPVDVSIRFRNLPNGEAIKRLEAALTLAKEQRRSASRGVAETAPEHVDQAAATAVARLAELRGNKVGMIEDSVTWVIEAEDLRTLKKRTDAAIDFYKNMGISVWAPPSVQDLMYQELIIGDRRRVTEFADFRPWDTVVGAWFHGGSALGSESGYYLASNIGSTPGPFINRLSDAQREGKQVTSAFVGTTGSGKSTAVCLSILGEVAATKGWGAITDFKGDLGGIVPAAESFGVPVTRVSTDEAQAGSLDPFRWVPDAKEAASLAVDNLMMALPVNTAANAESLIRKAANKVAAGSQVRSSWAVIQELEKDTNPVAREIGEQLAALAIDTLARPVFGTPDLTAMPLPTRPGLVYMRFVGMRWPGKQTARADWKPGHRLTIMLVQSAFAYLVYMAARVKGIPKVVALTELHYLLRYDFGKEFVGELALTGRALDVNLLLDTQSCRQLLEVESLKDQLSQVHCFAVTSEDEADAQALLLGLEPEQGFRDAQLQQNHSPDERPCIVRDRHGRIGPVQFDYLTADIQQLLQTDPDRDSDVTSMEEAA